MAETLLSPGVLTRENDQSQITQGPITAGAAIVGPTVKGPVRIPTLVTSYSDYISKFGGAFVTGGTTQEYLTSISTYNYFQQGGNSLLVTRVVSGTFVPATSSINSGITGIDGVYATSSLNISSFTSLETGSFVAMRFATPDIDFYIIPNTSGYEALDNTSSTRFYYASLNSGSSYTLDQWGDKVAQIINTGSWDLKNYFSASYSTGSDTLALSASVVGTAPNGVYKVYKATTVGGVGTLTSSLAGGASGTPSAAFTLETLSWGAIQNSTGATGNSNTLVNGTTDNIRWEVTNNDTASGTFNLLVRRGDDNINSKVVLESYSGLSLDPNNNNYIEAVIGNQSISTDNGYTDVTGDYTNKSRYVRVKSVLAPTPNYFDNNGVAKPQYTASIPLNNSGSFGGANGNLASVYGLSSNDYTSSLNLLANSDEFRYNVITVPGLLNSINSPAIALLTTNTQNRGDAIAIIDLVSEVASLATAVSEASKIDNSYTATYWPWVQVNAPQTGKLTWVPPSTIIPSVFAYNDRVAAPWFAPAGFTRGALSVIQAKRKLSPTDKDTLYAANINAIGTFPGQGVVAYGQKTLQKKASALDRINVRRLLIELKSYIGQVANTLVFEQNSNATRNKFLAQTNPYLESIKQREGLYAYKVVMDDTNNTADVIDRNQLVGQIFVQPTKTAEFIILDFNVTPTGATF